MVKKKENGYRLMRNRRRNSFIKEMEFLIDDKSLINDQMMWYAAV